MENKTMKIFNLFNKKKSDEYARLVKTISQFVSDERGAKCGYDLWMGYCKGDLEARYKAWIRYLGECRDKEDHCDAQRDGVWVPAIMLDNKK